MPSRLRLLGIALLALASTGAFDRREILCEEAIAHIQDCCPTMLALNVCGDGACGTSVVLTSEESHCILELECGPTAAAVCKELELLSYEVPGVLAGAVERRTVCP